MFLGVLTGQIVDGSYSQIGFGVHQAWVDRDVGVSLARAATLGGTRVLIMSVVDTSVVVRWWMSSLNIREKLPEMAGVGGMVVLHAQGVSVMTTLPSSSVDGGLKCFWRGQSAEVAVWPLASFFLP